MAPARTLASCLLVLLVCDVIGGFLAISSGADTWNHAWGFDTDATGPAGTRRHHLCIHTRYTHD